MMFPHQPRRFSDSFSVCYGDGVAPTDITDFPDILRSAGVQPARLHTARDSVHFGAKQGHAKKVVTSTCGGLAHRSWFHFWQRRSPFRRNLSHGHLREQQHARRLKQDLFVRHGGDSVKVVSSHTTLERTALHLHLRICGNRRRLPRSSPPRLAGHNRRGNNSSVEERRHAATHESRRLRRAGPDRAR